MGPPSTILPGMLRWVEPNLPSTSCRRRQRRVEVGTPKDCNKTAKIPIILVHVACLPLYFRTFFRSHLYSRTRRKSFRGQSADFKKWTYWVDVDVTPAASPIVRRVPIAIDGGRDASCIPEVGRRRTRLQRIPVYRHGIPLYTFSSNLGLLPGYYMFQ